MRWENKALFPKFVHIKCVRNVTTVSMWNLSVTERNDNSEIKKS